MRQEGAAKPLGNADLARILSPLLFFLAHVVYLALWSPDPFLTRWIEGSFTFFLALVLCNIIRARVVAAVGAAGDSDAGAPADPAAGPGRGADRARAGDEHPPG